jgi:hypothetical protein
MTPLDNDRPNNDRLDEDRLDNDMPNNDRLDGDRLDNDLKIAFRRQEPPAGFADRVLARTRQQARPARGSWMSFFTTPLVRWAAAGALAAVLILGGVRYQHLQQGRRERAQGEVAKQQLMLALHIAGSKLQLAKARVHEINPTKHQPVKE